MKALPLACFAVLALCAGCRGFEQPSSADASRTLVDQARAECRRVTDASAYPDCMKRAQQVYGGSSR